MDIRLTDEEIYTAILEGISDYKVSGGESPYPEKFMHRAMCKAQLKKVVEFGEQYANALEPEGIINERVQGVREFLTTLKEAANG